ncbi:MAG: HEAT repeat domain-containing protein [Myxococcaceae bacterium]
MFSRPSCLAALAVLLACPAAIARPSNDQQGMDVMEQYFQGQMGLNQAINRIQFLGAERLACAELVHALKRSSDRKLRPQFFDFLSQVAVRDNDVERMLLNGLGSDDASESIPAARGLGRIKAETAVKPLNAALEHKVLGVRREAARSLGKIGNPASGPPLMKAAKAETDLDVKILMLASVGLTGDKKQIAPLEALLKDESESTRMAAARGLCAMGTPSCATFANKLLASADKNERFSAVMLFEGAPAKAAAPVLSKVLEDKDVKLRARAARLLVEGGDQSKLAWLVIESAKAKGEERLPYEDELERLRMTDEQRQAILKKAGLQ